MSAQHREQSLVRKTVGIISQHLRPSRPKQQDRSCRISSSLTMPLIEYQQPIELSLIELGIR